MTTSAKIVQLNISPGGVPKLPVPGARVGPLGLAGDGHHYHRHGGRNRAVVLFGLEQIEQLQADGHPITPGAIGENVTTAGLNYRTLRVGDRLRLGEHVVLRLTGHADPCSKIAGAFADGDVTRVLEAKHRGMSRVTACVLTTGEIAPGDPIEVLPRHSGR